MIDKGRLLAITDGIVAIAATIMVLQLAIPDKVSFGAFLEQWPVMMAYIISFAQIFLAWHEHHDSVANARLFNHRIFLINCLWLFFLTLLPYVTGVLGKAPDHRFTVILYISVLFLVQLSITWESYAIQKLNHCKILDYDVIRIIRIISIIGYIIAGICAAFSTTWALVLVMALSIAEIVLMCSYDRKVGKKLADLEHHEIVEKIKEHSNVNK